MPVLKEWHCNDCETDFERISSVCPHCHGDNTKRTFLTPVGIARGRTDAHSARRTDEILAHQFDKLGVSNFHTSEFGRPNKIEWTPKHFGPSPNQGGQAPIIPTTGISSLAQLGFNPGALERSVDTDQGPWTVKYDLPTDAGAHIPAGTALGGSPSELISRTNTIGGIDIRGKQVVRVK